MSQSRIRAGTATQEPLRSESRIRTAGVAVDPAGTREAPAQSGEYAMRYALVRQILRRYLSPIMVDSVLDRAMVARSLEPSTLSDTALAEMTSEIMVGLRLFVSQNRLSELMLELAEVLGGGWK